MYLFDYADITKTINNSLTVLLTQSVRQALSRNLKTRNNLDAYLYLSKKYKDLDKFLSSFALDPPSKRVADQTKPLIDEGEEKGKVTVCNINRNPHY